jgi:large conductance mechanosensitive channel
MDGFKKFLLGGGLVPVAVAFIMGGAFSTVVTAFVNVIMDLIGKIGGLNTGFENWIPGGVHIGAFIIAVISFVIIGTFIYFLVVTPYTKAKERFFPDPEPGATEVDILTEIRDLLARDGGATPPTQG